MNILDRLRSAPYGAYAIDLNQTIVYWNEQAEQILGYKAQYAIGRKCYEVVQSLALDGTTSACKKNCPAIVAANRGEIHPVAYASMRCASGQRKQVTVFPLIATNESDEFVLVHMFHEAHPGQADIDSQVPVSLTPRELEILRLLAMGLRPSEVAEQLVISVHTVRKHISNASEKLHSHGMLSAVLAAQRHHLI